MVAVHDLLEALSSAGVTIEAHGGSLRYRPASALTPEMLSAVKSCKEDLLELLQDCSPSPKGLSAVGSSLSPNTAPGTQVHPFESVAQTPADGESRADIEFARFEKIAVPTSGGGLYDPINGSAEMPSGITGEQWDAFVADFAHLGKAVRS